MPHLKLTKRSIEDLPLATGKGLIYWDTDTPGFGLVVGRAQKSFIAQRQRLGRTTRKALGVFGEITVDQARHAALQTLIAIRNGDMLRETQERKKRESLTLMRVFDMFVQSRKDIRPRTLHDYQSTMRLYLNDWSNISLNDINKNMVHQKLVTLGERHGEYTANKAMRFLRTMFNFAMAMCEDVIHNPVQHLSRTKSWYKERRRETYIKKSELPRWWAAVQNLESDTARDVLLMTLFTGMRRMEVMSLAWDNIDFEERTLTVPMTKNGKPLVLPLTSFTYDLLLNRRDENPEGLWVFPSESRQGHYTDPKRAIEKVSHESGVQFMVHDLRRTFITLAEELDIPHYTLKRLVNHSITSDVTGGYIIANVERLRQPAQKVCDNILRICHAKEQSSLYRISNSLRSD